MTPMGTSFAFTELATRAVIRRGAFRILNSDGAISQSSEASVNGYQEQNDGCVQP